MKERISFGNIKHDFVGVEQLELRAIALDTASEKPVFVDNKEVPRYKAIWNNDKNRLSCLASKEYKIFQHKEFIDAVAGTLKDLGLNVSGTIINKDERVIANILIDKEVLINKEKFTMGFRITNSFDKSSAIRGDFYAVRLKCMNGMLIGQFKGIALREIHTTKKDVEQLVMTMVNNATKIEPMLGIMISEAMETNVEGKLLSQIWEKLSINEKWQKELTTILEKDCGRKIVYTKWEIYNAVTSLVSHHKTLGVTVGLWLEKKSEQLLKMHKEELLAPLIQ